MIPAFPKPKDVTRKRKRNHSIRNKRRTKRGMVLDLDKVARREIVEERDQNICQRCGHSDGEIYHEGSTTWISGIQWCHVITREYYITRWDVDNSFAGCNRCHKWWHTNPILAFDWFAKKYPERWERLKRILQGNCKTTDADIRALWQERVGGG